MTTHFYSISPKKRLGRILFLLPALLFLATSTQAQCTNWNIAAVNIQPSNCQANGSFTINISGTNAGNLTNIKYSIPPNPTGFTVIANNSSNFANIPAGTYPVQVDAICGGNNVSKTINVTVGGVYTRPSMQITVVRRPLPCRSNGKINLDIAGGKMPVTVNIITAPSSYSGPTQITPLSNRHTVDDLPAGNYTFQIVDACGTAMAPQSLDLFAADITKVVLMSGSGYIGAVGTSCNQISISKQIFINSGGLEGYPDTLFKIAYSLDLGQTISPYENFDNNPFIATLAPGKTLKDYYGKTINYFVKSPCGQVISGVLNFDPPNIISTVKQDCNGFKQDIYIGGIICFPITATLKNDLGYVIGRYTLNSPQTITTPQLPFSSNSLSYTTADGYSGTVAVYANTPPSTPYYVYPAQEEMGLNDRIRGFNFMSYLSSGFMPNTKIELISGPPGYTVSVIASTGSHQHSIYNNDALFPSPNYYFIPGTYVWKITDNCGSYTLPITVTDQDLYHYTIDASDRRMSCKGLEIYSKGTSTFQGNNKPVYFNVLKAPAGYIDRQNTTGPIVLDVTGTYVIGISSFRYSPSSIYSRYDTAWPSPYQMTATIIYEHKPLAVDINNSQAFLCVGAASGQGQIIMQGTGGLPFKAATPYYKYSLAAQGKGQTGPYIATNTTGKFPSTGASANDVYDIKIEDSCGAYVIQQIKVLDLSNTQLASAKGTALCEGDELQLYAIPLPGGNYSWTGPNGFTSTQRDPLIKNANPINSGQYTVTITTTYCNTPALSSIGITVNPAPQKATISVQCTGQTAVLTGSNIPGVNYQWYKDGNPMASATTNSYTVTQPGNYTLYTIDPATFCQTVSDSIVFTTVPGPIPAPTITASRTFLCANDSAILTAVFGARVLHYQWYLNGSPIAGATEETYTTYAPGDYKVSISTGPCSEVTSVITTIKQPIPPALLTALDATTFCYGDSVILEANTGTSLQYEWQKDGSTVKNSSNNIYTAKTSGIYNVKVNNGFCTTIAIAVKVTVNPVPVANLSPNDNVSICAGDAIILSTSVTTGDTYAWRYNGTIISGANGPTYTTSKAGNYDVIVNNGLCPADTSHTTTVTVLERPDPTIALDGPDHFCMGESVNILARPQQNVTYTWYWNDDEIPAATGTGYNVKNTGAYQLVVSKNGCNDTSTIANIVVYALPVSTIDRNDLVLTSDPFAQYQWFRDGQLIDGATEQSYHLSQTGTYTVMVTDVRGCQGISAPRLVASLEEACIVRVPSAFSPNNDGRNDVFRLIGNDPYHVREFRIMNRWGQTVFHTMDPTQSWDGTFNGVPQEIGTYHYYLQYKCESGSNMMTRQGDVTLVR